jgi:hypothetical protein
MSIYNIYYELSITLFDSGIVLNTPITTMESARVIIQRNGGIHNVLSRIVSPDSVYLYYRDELLTNNDYYINNLYTDVTERLDLINKSVTEIDTPEPSHPIVLVNFLTDVLYSLREYTIESICKIIELFSRLQSYSNVVFVDRSNTIDIIRSIQKNKSMLFEDFIDVESGDTDPDVRELVISHTGFWNTEEIFKNVCRLYTPYKNTLNIQNVLDGPRCDYREYTDRDHIQTRFKLLQKMYMKLYMFLPDIKQIDSCDFFTIYSYSPKL